jgi:proteasome accessory factor B
MPKSKYLIRFALLSRLVKSQPGITFFEIQHLVLQNLQNLNDKDGKTPISYSKRTFERDLEDLREAAGINISYDTSLKGYAIKNMEYGSKEVEQSIELLYDLHLMNLSQEIKQFLHFEPLPPTGSEHLFLILHCLKNKYRLTFSYHKFYEALPTHRKVEPILLKQFKRRWYLLAHDCGDGQTKTFGLDRISDLNDTREFFQYLSDFNPVEYYKNCFGIINPDEDDVPYDVELRFTGLQGKYIKTMPLHPSQYLISETAENTTIGLHIYITEDFIIEVLSHGSKVKVIKPEWFASHIEERHMAASRLYKEG